jgi:hypothetical protein
VRLFGKEITLILVQVYETSPADDIFGCRRQVELRRPVNSQLYVMVLQSNKRQSRLPVLAEEELERIETGGWILCEFPRGKSARANYRLYGSGPRVILCVYNLTSDEQLNLVNDT